MFPTRLDNENATRNQLLNQTGTYGSIYEQLVPPGTVDRLMSTIQVYKEDRLSQENLDEENLVHKKPLKMPNPRSMTNGLLLKVKNVGDLILFETGPVLL